MPQGICQLGRAASCTTLQPALVAAFGRWQLAFMDFVFNLGPSTSTYIPWWPGLQDSSSLPCLAIVDFNLLLFIDKIYAEICINRWTMDPAGAAANANAITNVNLNVNVNVGVNVNSIRQFRYLLHFRQGAWLGVAAISAAPTISDSDCICLQHFAACPVTSPPPPLPLPLSIHPFSFTDSHRFCFQFPQSILPN